MNWSTKSALKAKQEQQKKEVKDTFFEKGDQEPVQNPEDEWTDVSDESYLEIKGNEEWLFVKIQH